MEVNTEVSNLVNPFIQVISLLNNELQHLTKNGLLNYLRVQTQKYYLTNNFLHPQEKVKFKDSYFPIKASYKDLNTDFSDVSEVFGNYHNIILVGYAGSGKTTLLRHIFFNVLKEKNKIPIVIELRYLNNYKGSFEDLLYESIIKMNIEPSIAIFKRTLQSGNYIFLLDGYDEIYSSKKDEINRQLDLFFDSNPDNNFLITTRPGSGIEGTHRFFTFRVNDLTDEDIRDFVNKLVYPLERRENIMAVINEEGNDTYNHYLENPLLLSMFILAFKSHPEIPKKKSAFYRNVFDTLYSKHDGVNKNSYPREKLSQLEREDFEKILQIFSYISLSQEQILFTEEYLTDTLKTCKKTTGLKFNIEHLIFDLKTAISIIHQDGFKLTFPHRSMQEYFASEFIKQLPDDSKQFAYNKIIDTFSFNSNDSGSNFYDLCREIDSNSFTKYAVIPRLNSIVDLLEENPIQFYKLDAKAGISISISSSSRQYQEGIEGKHFFSMTKFYHVALSGPKNINFFDYINDYLNIYPINKIDNFPLESGASYKILSSLFTNIPEEHTPEFIRDFFSKRQEMWDIFIAYGILKEFDQLKVSIKDKIASLQNELSHKQYDIDEIIGK